MKMERWEWRRPRHTCLMALHSTSATRVMYSVAVARLRGSVQACTGGMALKE